MLVGSSACASSNPSSGSTRRTVVKVLPKSASATTPTRASGEDAAGAALDQRGDDAVDGPWVLDPGRVEVAADVDRDVRSLDVLVQDPSHEDRHLAGAGSAQLPHQQLAEGAGDAVMGGDHDLVGVGLDHRFDDVLGVTVDAEGDDVGPHRAQ